MNHDGTVFRERLGDPAEWTGDWRRPGNYLGGEQQQSVHARLEQNRPLMIGMMIRRQKSGVIAAVLCVSREAIDSRRREFGLARPRGCEPGVCPARWLNPARLQRIPA